MKVKLAANAELDLLTKGEVGEVLRSWHNEVRAGCRYLLFAANGVVDANGALAITGDQLGPAEGFIWDVRRLHIGGGTWDPTTNVAAAYINEPSPARVVVGALADDDYFPEHAVVLNFGSQLYITAAGLTPGDVMTVAGQVKEVPYQLGWSL